MSSKISAAERALSEAGICTRCGAFGETRDTAGQCSDCHNAGYYEWQARRKAQNERTKIEARAWWAARGIKPGDRVRIVSHGWCGAVVVQGIAKVGASGAYVVSSYQPGHLAPEGWRKCDAR